MYVNRRMVVWESVWESRLYKDEMRERGKKGEKRMVVGTTVLAEPSFKEVRGVTFACCHLK